MIKPTFTQRIFNNPKGIIFVRLEGRKIGEIHKVDGGYQYTPDGGAAGDVFTELAALYKHLEGDDE